MRPAIGDTMGRLDFIGDLDRSKIVALDFTTAEFRHEGAPHLRRRLGHAA